MEKIGAKEYGIAGAGAVIALVIAGFDALLFYGAGTALTAYLVAGKKTPIN